MNIILNLAVGGHFGGDPDGTTVFPQHMDVDYVRVWQPQAGLSGDYNDDGQVDAADYIVWRRTVGHTGIGLPADGSGNGTVGPEDYNVWVTSLGSFDEIASVAIYPVPEPSAAVPMAVSLMFLYAQRFIRAASMGREQNSNRTSTNATAR